MTATKGIGGFVRLEVIRKGSDYRKDSELFLFSVGFPLFNPELYSSDGCQLKIGESGRSCRILT